MKRLVSILLCVCLVSPWLYFCAGAIEISAAGAILMDADSGRVLYRHNERDVRYIASITKLMTALVALESGHGLDDVVEIKPEYTGVEGSSMYLQAGEQLTLETLLYGLLLASGNDAAMAIAGHCAGSVDAFVAQMNRKAAILGMSRTSFRNPSGLTQEGHCSTAEDMAKLAAACMKNDVIAGIVATKEINVGNRTFTNHNKLLWRYEGCVGMKTGYTERSGRTLISCAERDGQRLIVVTLDDPNDWVDHTALFDHGFSHYNNVEQICAGQVAARLPIKGSLVPFVDIVASADVVYPLKAGETLRAEVSLLEHVQAPVSKGDTAGTVTWYLGDSVVCKCSLIYGQNVASNKDTGNNLIRRLFHI